MAIWYILRPFANLLAIWYISPRFGILCQEKSGTPAFFVEHLPEVGIFGLDVLGPNYSRQVSQWYSVIPCGIRTLVSCS
jgi:hypothetical protein